MQRDNPSTPMTTEPSNDAPYSVYKDQLFPSILSESTQFGRNSEQTGFRVGQPSGSQKKILDSIISDIAFGCTDPW